MKKAMIGVSFLLLLLLLTACGSAKTYEIGITIPAGSTADYVYSDEEFRPAKDTIRISAGDGLTDTSVLLKGVQVKEKTAYEPAYLTPGMPVTMKVEKGAWFRIGVSVQNPTDQDIQVSVRVEDLKEIRIE